MYQVGASHNGCVRHGKGKMIDGSAIAIFEVCNIVCLCFFYTFFLYLLGL